MIRVLWSSECALSGRSEKTLSVQFALSAYFTAAVSRLILLLPIASSHTYSHLTSNCVNRDLFSLYEDVISVVNVAHLIQTVGSSTMFQQYPLDCLHCLSDFFL